MSVWDYMSTSYKSLNRAHSCVGSFTGPLEHNLIIGKHMRIEVQLLTPGGLQPMLDMQLCRRIATLELFRPRGEAQDLLFVTTEGHEFFLLQWNPEDGQVVTRDMGDVSNQIGRPTDNGQIDTVDPDGRLIGLHRYQGTFKVIPFGYKGQLEKAFNIWLEERQVLDIKFLYGCPEPTVVVLYQDNKNARHVRTYEVALQERDFVEGPWSQNNLDNGADLLIPVPPPLCGVLIFGKATIAYCSASAFVATPKPSSIKACGRVDADGSRYLLGCHNGLMHLLVITHENEKVTSLETKLLGRTSVASSLSYLDDGVVFVGSSSGDSQLIKLNLHPDIKGYNLEVIERSVCFGPVVDFCVVDSERRRGPGQVVNCSGDYRDGSLRIISNCIRINELASVELQGITGMWSLRAASDDPHDTFLVVSFINETRILAMDLQDVLEETEIEGFCSNVQTLFCHDAAYNQLVQVTSNSVRLVTAVNGSLSNEWFPPVGYPIRVATANSTQVLLATGGRCLIYLEIGDGVLIEVKHVQLEYNISCLDINPIGDNPNYSKVAAVGTWWDFEVTIFSLPALNPITSEPLGIVLRSVLLCSFEGISYLLCALVDGRLFKFVLDTSTHELTDMTKVSLGTDAILRTFSSKNGTYVFGASDRPFLIYSRNKKLVYSNVNEKVVSHMCPFSFAAVPYSFAIAKEGELTICTIDDIREVTCT